jgi:hypothetical protein
LSTVWEHERIDSSYLITAEGGIYSPLRTGKTPTAWRFTPQTWRSRAIARETLLDLLRFRYKSAGFTPQTWRSRAIARETLLDLLRFRYKSAGFRARKGFSPHELPKDSKISRLRIILLYDGVV